MTTDELIQQAEALTKRIQVYGVPQTGYSKAEAARAQVSEFLRIYSGPKSAFTKEAEAARGHDRYQVTLLTNIMNSYVEFLRSGLASGTSPEVKAQMDVVSDFLAQAHALLEQPKVHAAAPIVIAGASLEEFLRTWLEREGLSTGNTKPGIDTYAKTLREADQITKQDIKDITAWSGLRNHAAHGEWELVSDRQQAGLMLQGINLFMRKYTP